LELGSPERSIGKFKLHYDRARIGEEVLLRNLLHGLAVEILFTSILKFTQIKCYLRPFNNPN